MANRPGGEEQTPGLRPMSGLFRVLPARAPQAWRKSLAANQTLFKTYSMFFSFEFVEVRPQ